MQEGHSPELAIFQTPVVDTGVESIEWVGYRPVSQLTSAIGPIEFNIAGHSTSYIDLYRTRLHVKFRITKEDGTPVAIANKVGVVNLALQTFWSQVDVSLQNQVVSPNIGNNYAFKSYIDVLLKNEEDPKLSWLQAQLFFVDTHSYMDESDPAGGNNTGLLKRFELTSAGNETDMEGPLYTDITRQRKFILNGVQVNVKLWPNKPEFSLMSSEEGAKYGLRITDAVLKVCMVKVNPGIIIGHAEALETVPATYPYTKTDIRTFSIATGQYAVSIEDVFQGTIPSSLIVGLVASQAYSGNLKRNPFNFQHFNCTNVGFYVDGRSVPTAPIQTNFAKKNSIEAYMTLFTGTGTYDTNAGNYISREEYDEGYTLYILDVDGKHGSTEHAYLKRGHTRLEMRFASPLPEAVTLIAYGSFPASLQIDKSRNVRL